MLLLFIEIPVKILYMADLDMDIHQITGLVLVIISLSFIVTFTIWARQRINKIAEQGYSTARQTLKGKNGQPSGQK